MAKAKTAAAPKKVKKAAKAQKAVAKATPKPARKTGKKKADGKGVEVLWKLAEHPLVGELLAIGATAAVAAIAEGSGTGKKHRSSAAVKQAGKAAAAAIGARLISEFADGKKPAKAKPAKAKPAKA
jgi:hypothetical protein